MLLLLWHGLLSTSRVPGLNVGVAIVIVGVAIVVVVGVVMGVAAVGVVSLLSH